MSDVRRLLDDEAREHLEPEGYPDGLRPMLATLTDEPFSDPDWIYERKLDGERALAYVNGDKIRLVTRNGIELDDTYPEIVDALEATVGAPAVLDGEVVAFSDGVTSFARLQHRMQIQDPGAARASGVAVHYYVFDCLHLDGWSLRTVGLRDRKRLLKTTFDFADPLRFVPHRNETGQAYLHEACRKGWEGLIAKRANSGYHQDRSRDWLKFKCVNQQEFVIGGWTDPKGQRKRFGALLVGAHENGELRYAGKVGTGFDRTTLDRIGDLLDGRERDTSPFADDVPGADVHWVAPDLVAQVGFTEWTRDGRLRHPRYLGLRRDKEPEDVVREHPS